MQTPFWNPDFESWDRFGVSHVAKTKAPRRFERIGEANSVLK